MKNIELQQNKIGIWDEEHNGYFMVDPYDDEPFYAKRSDTRFRNNKNRSAFHNLKNRAGRRKQSAINTAIRRNRNILEKFYMQSQDHFKITLKKSWI